LTGGDQLLPPARTDYAFQLVNHYGPTEATVVATAGTVVAAAGTARLPGIGRPIANVRIYLMDRHLNLVPVGAAGEICIGGVGVARGYLNQPDLTAERFVDDPFGEGKLYRSGDLGRYRADGQIEYLGRFDEQVKIGGVRIELGEIEAALVSHPGVAGAAVITVGDSSPERRLVAYFVPSPDAAPSVSSLKRFLEERLPASLVPSLFVRLTSLPLTSSGKTDRRALPAPEKTWQRTEETYAAPRNPVEEIVTGVWEDVLGLPRVGSDDDFFELGGNSLIAIQVLSRLRRALGFEVPLRILFEGRTPAGLARMAETLEGARESAPSVIPRRARADERNPLSFGQLRLWFLDQLAPGGFVHNVPRAFRLRGVIDRRALERSLEQIVQRHEILRTSFPSIAGEPAQVVASPSSFHLESANLETAADPAVQAALEEEARRSFDLESGHLFRAKLFRIDEGEHILLLTWHHMIIDAWSLAVFQRELVASYEAFVSNREPDLPELAIQYKDFVWWQRDSAQKRLLENQRDYWRRRLTGAPAILTMPLDGPALPSRPFAAAPLRFMCLATSPMDFERLRAAPARHCSWRFWRHSRLA
jgi:hypothetical protein